ncbi:MAG: hypothetical protein ACM3JB_11310 [Acidobacteriaceae bacterium]
MKMRFALAALLRLRELREEQERARLLTAKAAEAKTLEDVRRISELRKGAVSMETDTPGILSAHIGFVRECCTVLREQEKRARDRQEQAATACERQEHVYRSALLEFKVLDRFRGRQLEAFQLEERRGEQKSLDEAYAMTHLERSGQGLPNCPADLAQDSRRDLENLSASNIGIDAQLL